MVKSQSNDIHIKYVKKNVGHMRELYKVQRTMSLRT